MKVNIKWNGQKFSDVELDTSELPAIFKMQIYSLTQVPPERQKLLAKGKAIGDEDDWGKFKLKEGMTMMLMGTVGDSVLKEPTKPQVFLEDLPESQQDAAKTVDPAGIENIGNTCYLNATLQCLRIVPELRSKLASYQPQAQSPDALLTRSLSTLYGNLDSIGNMTNPTMFNTVFRQTYPQFNEETEHGHHKQQDADEAWSAVIQSLSTQLKTDENKSLVENLFGIRFQSTLQCLEAPEEDPQVMEEKSNKLSCHITVDINFLLDGVKLAMAGSVTKRSPSLNRDAEYEKSTVATHLPPWLTVNFVRFFYKQDTQKKAKILRAVKFPRLLDLIDLCDENTQRALRRRRAIKIKQEDKEREERDKASEAKPAASSSSTDPQPAEAAPAEGEGAMATEEDDGADLPEPEFTAEYELKAVLTHTGRTLDSGHYIAWVHRQGEEWLCFDDQRVTRCNYEEDILRLVGGGDWHTAYLCLYQERKD